MLLNQVEIPISLGLSFRHCLNDAPANTSTLTWHLLSLLLSPTSSVRLLIFPLESWVVFKKKKKKICLYSWKWHFFWWAIHFLSLMNFKLYAALTAFLLLEVSSYTITLQKNPSCSEPNCCLAPCTDAWYESEPEQWKAIYYMMASSGLC